MYIFVVIKGILIPLIGTVAGALCVFFIKGDINKSIKFCLQGFAAGVMVAASVWSLLIPSVDYSSSMGFFAFVPAVTGLIIGFVALMLSEKLILYLGSKMNLDTKSKRKNALLVLAVVIHNIPEGMAVGVIFAGLLNGLNLVTVAAAFSVAIGIALQNFPEGAIISMPLAADGMNKGKAFMYGALSGVVEPLGALLTILAFSLITPILPYLLSFAAGAMLYVVVEELIPDISEDNNCFSGTLSFAIGFSLMMALDVALG
ncbi:MAG: ZIP family metal transporter [Clostridia bacterium]|nr:ZIP family metal transporter [Clostridia bacterium]